MMSLSSLVREASFIQSASGSLMAVMEPTGADVQQPVEVVNRGTRLTVEQGGHLFADILIDDQELQRLLAGSSSSDFLLSHASPEGIVFFELVRVIQATGLEGDRT